MYIKNKKQESSLKSLIIFLFTLSALSQEVEEIRVQDLNTELKLKGGLKDSIIKTEVLESKDLEKKQAKNLAEAVQNQKGIEAREGCSICGMRRVRINGLKGEHTTVLMDGIPLNSTVSSYYGFDSMGTSGIDRIEISRGAGASLIAPEAIGGVINVIRKKATKNEAQIDFSVGEFGYKNFSSTLTRVSKNGKSGTTLSAQFNEQDQRDEDNNNINESPSLSGHTFGLKHFIDLNERNNLTIDITSLKSKTLGGFMGVSLFEPSNNVGPLSFEDNDVRKRYTGAPDKVSELVEIERKELTLSYTHLLNSFSNLVFKQSYAEQIQDSWYEGSDYYHENETLFSDIQYNNQINEKHFLTLGLDYKKENLESKSHDFYVVGLRNKDDYDYKSLGLYIRDIWSASETIELSTALRVNKITTDWTDQSALENEIDETIFAPRLHLKWSHKKNLISRIGAGIGYRSPLTFFESEHGILDDGFDVDISELEKSKSLTYSLAYNTKRFLINGGFSFTDVENLAFVDSDLAIPTLKNFDQKLSVRNYDITLSYQISTPINIALTYEAFDYEDNYKSLMVIAAVEQRAKLDFEYETDSLKANVLATWIGSRNLSEFGYDDRFNVYDGVTRSEAKSTKAPSYVMVDFKLNYKLNKEYALYAGVKNVFNEVQKESPLFFDADNELDVTHIYGPLRGRQVYVGIQATL